MKVNPALAFLSSLRGRLLVLVCLATLPATLFTFYVAHTERESILRRAESESKYLLKIVSGENVNRITSAKTLLRWLAGKTAKDQSLLLKDKTYLSALLAGYPQLANIAYLAPNGNVLNSAYPIGVPVNMSGYEAIRRAILSDQPEAGAYVIGPIVKRPLFHLAQSVRNNQGDVAGVVFVALDLEYMNKLLKEVELPAGHFLHVLDRNGNVLASSNGISHQPSKGGEWVRAPMEGLPGVHIATFIPYDKIRSDGNFAFLRVVSLLSLLTLFTVVSVVFLEEISLLRYLRMLTRVSRKFGEGDLSVRLKISGKYGELEKLANAFNVMADTLEQRHSQLVEAHTQLNNLTRHLQLARESERLQIARDLHDEVGQVLTSIKMDLSGFAQLCPSTGPLPCYPNVDEIRRKLDSLVAFIRRIASSLRPPVLDGIGLKGALEILARDTERNSDVIINTEITVDEPLNWHVSTTVYRIVQESLTNVIRHAQASEVNIRIFSEGNFIHLSVSDDGVGLPKMNPPINSFGLMGMRERAKMLEGSFDVYDNGQGTTVEATIPMTGVTDSYAHPTC